MGEMGGVCSECRGELKTEETETVCGDCGLVTMAHPVDPGPEWRSFDDEESTRARTGAPRTRSRHDRGLSTEIGRDSQLGGQKRRQLARLRREHGRAQIASKRERNCVYGFSEIRRLQSALSVPEDVREQACVLFESAQTENLLRGRSIEGFAAASVYGVCRSRSLSRTVEEIVEVARAEPGELRAAYDAMNRELGLPTGPIDPGEYLARFASDLEVGVSVERRARDLLGEARDQNLVCGKHPCGVAAACLYTAAIDSETPLTQAETADVAGVTPVTLRSTYQALLN